MRDKGLLLCLSLVTALAAQPAAPDPSKRAAERIRALQREADALLARERTLLDELRTLEIERQLKVEEVAKSDRAAAETERKLAVTTRRLAQLRQTADEQRPDVEARLVQLYKLGSGGYWRLLMDVDDLRSMGRAYRTASAMTSLDTLRVLQHQQTLDALAAERTALQARARELAAEREAARTARAALDRAVASRNALVESIDQRRDLNAQLAGELQNAQQRLQTSVGELPEALAAAAAGLPIRPFQGALPWPARGAVTSRFGRQGTSALGTPVVRNGVELGTADGSAVRAVHEGTVAFAGPFTGYGNLVIVDHGDRSYSLYGHLAGLDVTTGQRVEVQAPLGTSGRNPAGTPALYFELRIDGAAVDPLQWLKR
ncbi:MAG TPA: peptidoglycan DD-metalloendopeptidase family protein [Vicinamibacterales bacterium]|jgi:septal ring factor EnvC (AmiA/AmiB activator)|nr:peptidoglycan DD-metalloendopeptidase family protein [Vicinamibacterales bacterium]